MTGSLLFQAIVFLAGAIICVSIVKRLGLSSVLGYLLAGVLIGPYVLGFIGEEGDDILHFAEFGVVVMLFLIGLEIEPKNFWKMRKSILGMGGIQVGLTMIFTYAFFYVMGLYLASFLSNCNGRCTIIYRNCLTDHQGKRTYGDYFWLVFIFYTIVSGYYSNLYVRSITITF